MRICICHYACSAGRPAKGVLHSAHMHMSLCTQCRPPCQGRATFHGNYDFLQNGNCSGGLGFCLLKVQSFFVCKECAGRSDEAVVS